MNILYLAHRIPYPPNKGDKVRSFHQVRHLCSKHAVHLACLVDDPQDLQHLDSLRAYCASVDSVFRSSLHAKALGALGLAGRSPLSVVSFYSRDLRRRITDLLERNAIDCIVVYSSQMAEYVRDISGIRRIVDFVDLDSEKWRLYSSYHRFPLSWTYRIEADRLARYERSVAGTFDHTLFVSEAEARLFRQNGGQGAIAVITNGVDLDYFSPDVDSQPYPGTPIIAFSGAMDYFPNGDAVHFFSEQVLPRIRQAVPAVQFHIIGRNPTPPVQALHNPPHVQVTGTVPDIRPYLRKARIAVAPFRIARGIPNKILEAMAMGLPVVGTSVAFQGTFATESDGVRIVDDPKAFAHTVCDLLADGAVHEECSYLARDYVERRHRWEHHGAQLDRVLAGLH